MCHGVSFGGEGMAWHGMACMIRSITGDGWSLWSSMANARIAANAGAGTVPTHEQSPSPYLAYRRPTLHAFHLLFLINYCKH